MIDKYDNCVVLACSSLAANINAAQKKTGNYFEVIYLKKDLHCEPLRIKEKIENALREIKESSTVLMAIGMCGGWVENLKTRHRLVVPEVDDCVTMLLHRGNRKGFNLKDNRCIYMKDISPSSFDLENSFEEYTKDLSEEARHRMKIRWQASYDRVCVVDTGLNNILSDEYKKYAEKNADWIGGEIEYEKGSNIVIENLLSFKWDDFLIIEPNDY